MFVFCTLQFLQVTSTAMTKLPVIASPLYRFVLMLIYPNESVAVITDIYIALNGTLKSCPFTEYS